MPCQPRHIHSRADNRAAQGDTSWFVHWVSTDVALTHSHIGKFNIQIEGYSAEDEELLCLKLTVDFTKRFPFFS